MAYSIQAPGAHEPLGQATGQQVRPFPVASSRPTLALYIRPGDGLGLFYSSQGPHWSKVVSDYSS